LSTGNVHSPQGLEIQGWLFTALFLMVAVICLAAGVGRLRANGMIGIRIPSFMRSDAAWKAGHAAGVKPAFISFAVSLACSTVGLSTPTEYFGSVAALVGGVVWMVVRALRAANAAT